MGMILILNQFHLNDFDFDWKSIYSTMILILLSENQNHTLTNLQISNEVYNIISFSLK